MNNSILLSNRHLKIYISEFSLSGSTQEYARGAVKIASRAVTVKYITQQKLKVISRQFKGQEVPYNCELLICSWVQGVDDEALIKDFSHSVKQLAHSTAP